MRFKVKNEENLAVGTIVKIKHGATIFYNFGSNSLRFTPKVGWTISQVHKNESKDLGRCYTKKITFNGTAEVQDPEILFGEQFIFCRVVLADEVFHVLKDDLVRENENNAVPAKRWQITNKEETK